MKKEPIKKWEKANNRTIAITGMRNSEGGERASIKGCILTDKNGNQGNAAISVAGGSSTGKNGLRIYNRITNDLGQTYKSRALVVAERDVSAFSGSLREIVDAVEETPW